jgi:hypothetical protein
LLLRKYYKALNGAGAGDLFMSLIHTCELNGGSPFEYLSGATSARSILRAVLRHLNLKRHIAGQRRKRF